MEGLGSEGRYMVREIPFSCKEWGVQRYVEQENTRSTFYYESPIEIIEIFSLP